MKREVERQKPLPAFRLDVVELGLLVTKMLALFDEPSEVRCSISVELPAETLEFSNFDEMKEYRGFPESIKKFSVWLSQGSRRVSIHAGQIGGYRPKVSAQSEFEAWCAGAVETVFIFASSHKVWYHWFAAAPIGLFLAALMVGTQFVAIFVPKEAKVPPAAVVGWLLLAGISALLVMLRPKLFPAAVITIRQSESWFKRHVAELSLVVAILSALLTIIGWFFSK
jgi:hypothetical protein